LYIVHRQYTIIAAGVKPLPPPLHAGAVERLLSENRPTASLGAGSPIAGRSTIPFPGRFDPPPRDAVIERDKEDE